MAKTKVEARVLADLYINGNKVPCNSVLVIDKAKLKDYDGLDDSAEAVAYAKAEGAEPVDFDSLFDLSAEE